MACENDAVATSIRPRPMRTPSMSDIGAWLFYHSLVERSDSSATALYN
ncbi:hypothetical protein XCCB100_1865 [Xanthomonas campestris pv. campestris]|uniref:Uncharacterized protein n=1 Tax=Xanthomonas campestris pv. campestris (strain B100) TaxID=509169 RepID=B0RRY3_XANCB|nr:hypothetical protein XCCB100_1865 [Xanthomonas campestris pv. campestris]